MGDSMKRIPRDAKGRWAKLLLCGIVLVYAAMLLHIVFFKYGENTEGPSLNLEPFWIFSLLRYDAYRTMGIINILGNIALFLPMGILFSYGLSAGKKAWLSIPACLLVSAVFELLQWTTGTGATDIDDIILNTAGGALGAAIYFWILRRADAGRPYPWALIGALLIFGIVGGIFFYAYAPAVLFP